MRCIEIYFSPTGGTKRVADRLAEGLGEACELVDLCLLENAPVTMDEQDVAVIAAPVYGGRIPQAAIDRLMGISGNGARAVVVAVYGNRDYEDALLELSDAAKQAGFSVVAGVAAIAEHSIARRFGANRPDEQDAIQLETFARKIRETLAFELRPVSLPGNRPYKTRSVKSMVPQATEDCNACGICARKCPLGAIDWVKVQTADPEKCIGCMRCIAVCPSHARKGDEQMLQMIEAFLTKTASVRRENELFLQKTPLGGFVR